MEAGTRCIILVLWERERFSYHAFLRLVPAVLLWRRMWVLWSDWLGMFGDGTEEGDPEHGEETPYG